MLMRPNIYDTEISSVRRYWRPRHKVWTALHIPHHNTGHWLCVCVCLAVARISHDLHNIHLHTKWWILNDSGCRLSPLLPCLRGDCEHFCRCCCGIRISRWISVPRFCSHALTLSAAVNLMYDLYYIFFFFSTIIRFYMAIIPILPIHSFIHSPSAEPFPIVCVRISNAIYKLTKTNTKNMRNNNKMRARQIACEPIRRAFCFILFFFNEYWNSGDDERAALFHWTQFFSSKMLLFSFIGSFTRYGKHIGPSKRWQFTSSAFSLANRSENCT